MFIGNKLIKRKKEKDRDKFIKNIYELIALRFDSIQNIFLSREFKKENI